MDQARLVNSMRVVEVSAETRTPALWELVRATALDGEGIRLDDVLQGIEEREATAQTIIDGSFAIPHAVIDWNGDYRVVLGRSRTGVDFGIPESGRIHLIVLLVVSRARQAELHLDLLAALAELLESHEFRAQLVAARDTGAIELLLRTKVGSASEGRVHPPADVPRINAILARHAIDLSREISAQAVLLAVNNLDSVPWQPLSEWAGRLLIVASEPGDAVSVERPDTHLFYVPHAGLTRIDRANLGLLLAASAELLVDDAKVVCVTGPQGRQLDSVNVTRPKTRLGAMFGGRTTRPSARIRPEVILRALSLAVELGEEGREGQPVGAMFVIGDARHVMRYAQQLVLNPFHGYSRSLRSLLDPSLAETIKEFASIDGAFVVQSDGVVLSAGTYLVPDARSTRLQGLGTRHQAAAAITAQTEAMAITVSQSTGTVTVFRNGEIVLTLEKATQTRL